MSAKPTATAPVETAPEPVPATQYERFLAALPEEFREGCRSKLDGSGFAVNHPVFLALAQLYEHERKKPARNFIQEATLHADLTTKLINDLKNLPEAIMGKIDPQLHGLLLALNDPLQRLENLVAIHQSPKEPLPPPPEPVANAAPPKPKSKFLGWLAQIISTVTATVSNPVAWVVTGSISTAVAVMILCFGAVHLSHAYEAAYQDRVAHMEADSAIDTVALTHLLAAGITLQVERSPDDTAWYLILPGAHKAAQPVNSPEGLAIEVWP